MVDETALLPLTAAQHGIWLGQLLAPGSRLFNVAECLELKGPIGYPELLAALSQAVDEAEALQVRFIQRGSEVWQQPQRTPQPLNLLNRPSQHEPWVPRINLRATDQPAEAARQWMANDVAQAFDLAQGPIVRAALLDCGAQHAFLYLATHHIALDGFGFSLVMRRIASLYNLQKGGTAGSATAYGSLRAVVDEDTLYQQSPQCAADAGYWSHALRYAPRPPTLSESAASSAKESAQRCLFEVSGEDKRALDRLSRGLGGNWADGLLATMVALLHRHRASYRVRLGLPVLGRQSPEALRTPSMLMNILPLDITLHRGTTPSELIAAIRQQREQDLHHQRYRYEQLRRDLQPLAGHRELFGPIANIIPFTYGLRMDGLHAELHSLAAGPVDDLALGVRPQPTGQATGASRESGLSCGLDGNPARYNPTQLGTYCEAFQAELQRFLRQPQQPLTQEHGRKPSAVLQGPRLQSHALDPLAALWRQAERKGAHPALQHGEVRVSYHALAQQVHALGQRLQELGVRPQERVLLLAEPTIPTVVALLATLSIGATYLPLAPDGPPGRLAALLADARPAWILAQSSALHRHEDRSSLPPVLWLDDLTQQSIAQEPPSPATLPPAPEAEMDATAYIIYTSGSTGTPNGVSVSRGALAHFCAAARQRYEWNESDRVLQFAPLQFDASIEELFVTLTSGATLVLRPDTTPLSIQQLLDLCERDTISVLDLPTALFHELCLALGNNQRWPSCVRSVIIGGEAAHAERVATFLQATVGRVRLLNTYGPTETTVVATSAELSAWHGRGEALPTPLPIGSPLPGLEAVLLDPRQRPLPAPSPEHFGELALLGPTLASGYLNQPARSAERFIHLPELPGAPLAYRTGDRAFIDSCGELRFAGRFDDELKVSGQRVHPAEIERHLRRHPAVHEAVVLAQPGTDGTPRLHAHICTEGDQLTAATLQAHCAGELLPAAVPRTFHFHIALPKSSSGKVDRAALRRLTPQRPLDGQETPRQAASPQANLEDQVLRCWREVLEDDHLQADQDFFEAGGQSLQAIQVVSRLAALLQTDIAASLLFEHPTAAALARALTAQQDPAAQTTEATADTPALPPLVWEDTRLPPLRAPLASEPQLREGSPPPQRQVLLTGATGFVGPHLLQALLTTTAAHVVCLVRAPDTRTATDRLQAALANHGLPAAPPERVSAWPADLGAPRLGLSGHAWAQLVAECDTLYHNAAVVSLTRHYNSLRSTNVLSLHPLLELATSGSTPKPLHHISTLAVALGQPARPIRETFVDTPLGLTDGYTQSKWAAEHLLMRAHAAGVPVSLYRLGRVVGPLARGTANPQDLVFRLLQAGLRNGVLPDLPLQEPWTPADELATALVQLAQLPRPKAPIYHLTPRPNVSLQALFHCARDMGYAVHSQGITEFKQTLASSDHPDDQAILAFLELNQARGSKGPVRADVDCSQLRATLPGCPSGPFTPQDLRRYLDYALAQGLLPQPTGRTRLAQ